MSRTICLIAFNDQEWARELNEMLEEEREHGDAETLFTPSTFKIEAERIPDGALQNTADWNRWWLQEGIEHEEGYWYEIYCDYQWEWIASYALMVALGGVQ